MFTTMKQFIIILLPILYLVIFITGCEHATQPEEYKYPLNDGIFLSELDNLKHTGIGIQNKKGFFAVEWGHQFNLYEDSSSTAINNIVTVIFETINTNEFCPPNGIEVGDITFKVEGTEIDLKKFKTSNNGKYYLGPLGSYYDVNPIPCRPNKNFQFISSGSTVLDAFNIILLSPPTMIYITNPSKNDTIDISQGLTIAWRGGIPNENIMIKIHPVILFKTDFPTEEQWQKDREIIIKIFENNSGEFTLSSNQIQELINNYQDLIDIAENSYISCSVSQFCQYDIEINNDPFLFYIQNRDKVEVEFQ